MPAEATNAAASASAQAGVHGAVRSLDEAHKLLLRNRGIQFVFEDAKPRPPDRPPPHWLKVLGDMFGAMAPVLQVIFWVGVAAVVGLILFVIIRELGWVRLGGGAKKPLDLEYRPDATTARALLADADELAREGRFAEAVHVLLQRSVEDLRRLRPRAIGPSYTSREIAVLPALPERVRPAFAAMAQMVERSLFGGAPVAPEDFASARASYEAFAFAEAWT